MDETLIDNPGNVPSTFYEPADFVATLTDSQRARIWETNYGRDSGWVVEHCGEPVALLSEPMDEDMFWVSYQVTPLTQNQQVLSRLYTKDFWHKFDELVFRSQEFGVIVLHAFPAANLDSLSETGRITMRALYLDIGPPPPPLSKFGLWLRRILHKSVKPSEQQ